jgi:hypothetical protein
LLKRGCAVFFLLALCTVVLAAIALVAADLKYEALRAAPRVAEDVLYTGDTRAVLAVDPQVNPDLLTRLLVNKGGVPEWAAPYVAPYRFAGLCDWNLPSGTLGVRLFTNSRRLGPLIAKQMNRSGQFSQFGLVQWSAEGMTSKERGVLVVEGATQLAMDEARQAQDQWGPVVPPEPMRLQGGHLIEGFVDNRTGAGYALFNQFVAPRLGQDNERLVKFAADALLTLMNGRIHGDYISDNELAFHIALECGSDPGGASPDAIEFVLKSASNLLFQALRAYGAELEGDTSIHGLTVEGDYTIHNAGQLITMYLE